MKGRNGRRGTLALGLGWFSVGLGVTQLVAPRRLARAIGLRAGETQSRIMRARGLGEVAQGVGILSRPRPAGLLWSRVAGDVLDVTLLAVADKRQRQRGAAAMAAVAGVALPDLLESVRLTRNVDPNAEDEAGVHVKAAVTVRLPRQAAYEYWRNFENFPRFMAHVESVQTIDDGRSRWRATSPTGTVDWEAETVEDVPGERLSWRTTAGADIHHSGTVRFADASLDRGTEIHVDLRYDPPGGGLAVILAKVVGEDPEQQVKDDLRRFKQLLETGDIPVSEGNPEGQSARRQLRQKPASPASLEGAVR